METYRAVLRCIKEKHPVDYPVYVRRLPIAKTLNGDCQFKDDHFLIRISKELGESQAIDTLLHEYAHAMAWHKCTGDEDHCDHWGKSFSRVYRTFEKDFLT